MAALLRYQICVQGVLDSRWADYFAPFGLSVSGEQTLLTGPVHDQAELFGVLWKIRDLGLVLISLNQVREIPAFGIDSAAARRW